MKRKTMTTMVAIITAIMFIFTSLAPAEFNDYDGQNGYAPEGGEFGNQYGTTGSSEMAPDDSQMQEGSCKFVPMNYGSVTLNVLSCPLTKTYELEFLEIHNIFRCLHGVPKLKWSETLAQSAQAQADKCEGPTKTSTVGNDIDTYFSNSSLIENIH
ncbi:MAG: hypothetical protein GTN53_33425, partial [Candidatus Aminicenantes bacterium]|nr:hypothetical protein [Candidatus Aminicenantes bacterium]NIT27414.1 hypothetical protein [Candidatus Aminicenantes bacterium]